MKAMAAMMLLGLMALTNSSAQAGVIEDLLAIPAIQSLLGRTQELPSLVRNCQNVSYRQRNQAFCQRAEQAAQLARMPHELRVVMSNPASAQSIRELCVSAIGKPAQDSYLCAELYKSDESFKAMAAQQQKLLQQQNRESPG